MGTAMRRLSPLFSMYQILFIISRALDVIPGASSLLFRTQTRIYLLILSRKTGALNCLEILELRGKGHESRSESFGGKIDE